MMDPIEEFEERTKFSMSNEEQEAAGTAEELEDDPGQEDLQDPEDQQEEPEPEPEHAPQRKRIKKVKVSAAAKKSTVKAKKSMKKTKKSAAKKSKSSSNHRGRTSSLTGKKLYHAGKNHGLNEKKRRFKTYSMIKDGMTYEAFVAKKGNVGDLANLVKNGKVKVKNA